WPHARTTDTLFTDAAIEVGDYVSEQRTSFRYSSVDQIEVSCWYNSKGNAETSYRLHLSGNRWIDVLYQKDLDGHLDDLSHIDDKVRSVGAKVVIPERHPPGSGPVSDLDPNCVSEMANGRDAAKIFRIFHVDAPGVEVPSLSQ